MIEDTERGITVMKKTNEVSKLAGVSRRTLQYYDDQGLISTKRSKYNHRLYDKKALKDIWEILLYKHMDFELKDISQLLMLSDNQKNNYLELKKNSIQKTISELEAQLSFISFVQNQGIPPLPADNEEMTYTECVEKLKQATYEGRL